MTPTTAVATTPRCCVVSFLPDPARVARIRRVATAHLRLWELGYLIADVRLLVSELVTNAVVHGRHLEPVEFRMTYSAPPTNCSSRPWTVHGPGPAPSGG
ncbi:ATP-binding protein [Streptomyces sp. M19]